MLALYPLFRLTWVPQQGVDLNRAMFAWQASVVDATHPVPDVYTVKAGLVPGGPYPLTYTLTGVPLPTSLPVSQVITTPGTYYSVVAASNFYGEAIAASEVKFIVGYAPQFPSGYSIMIL